MIPILIMNSFLAVDQDACQDVILMKTAQVSLQMRQAYLIW